MNINHFYNQYFKPQDVIRQNRVFSQAHIVLTTLIVCGIVTIMAIQKRKQNPYFSQRILKVLGVLMLLLELFRMAWRAYYYGMHWTILRFDWCNQICMVLPFIAMFRLEKLYPYIDVAAFLGGAAVLIYPLWVFYDYTGIHVMSIQSMVSHGLMVTIALSMPMSSTRGYHRSLRQMRKQLIGMSGILAVAFWASIIFNTNYLLMRNARGIPVIGSMPAPYYWLIVLPILILGMDFATRLLRRFDFWMANHRPCPPKRRKVAFLHGRV
jgi:hypothetical protein